MKNFLNVAVPFLQTALTNNEMCLWVYTQNIDENQIIKSMSLNFRNIDKYIESGQLLLIPYTNWYLKDDLFNEVRANEHWIEYIDKAVELGYDGLRAVADTA